MTEAYVTSRILEKMRERGIMARKIGGSLYASQLPDLYACKSGVTIFCEVKLFKNMQFEGFRPSWLEINPQLLMMKDHGKHAVAMYLIFIHDGQKLKMMDFTPDEIMDSITTRTEIVRPFKEIDTWLREHFLVLFPGRGTPSSSSH